MNSVNEKEKKLNLALTKLKNLNLKNPELQNNIEDLMSAQSIPLLPINNEYHQPKKIVNNL